MSTVSAAFVLLLFFSTHDGGHGERFIGCYRDAKGARVLNAAQANFNGTLTVRTCLRYCTDHSYRYAGTKMRYQCFCSHQRPSYKKWMPEENCSLPCDGDHTAHCGGLQHISVYDTNDNGMENHVGFNYVGCYETTPEKRLLPLGSLNHSGMTPDFCAGFCHRHRFEFAAVIQGTICDCGHSLEDNSRVRNDDCKEKCAGNPNIVCGDLNRASVYETQLSEVGPMYLGCYKNGNKTIKLLSGKQKNFPETLDNYACFDMCSNEGFQYAGTANGNECYCSNSRPSFVDLDDEDMCDTPCAGNSRQKCGGPSRVSVYDLKFEKGVNHVLKLFVGCFNNANNSTLTHGEATVLDYTTPEKCVAFCLSRSYAWAGVQLGEQCFCGNKFDKTKNKVASSECTLECDGDDTLECGGDSMLSVYTTVTQDMGEYYVGCYKDSAESRAFEGPKLFDGSINAEACVGFCRSRGFQLSGFYPIEGCSCGGRVDKANKVENRMCFMGCSKADDCSTHSVLKVYSTGSLVAPWGKYLGCYRDRSRQQRKLLNGSTQNFRGTLTNKKCIDYCKSKGFRFSGTEWRLECYCSNDRPPFTSLTDEEDCNLQCDGYAEETCGGWLRINVYDTAGAEVDDVASLHLGCYSTSAKQRNEMISTKMKLLTPTACVGFCFRRGYLHAATFAGNSCYCGDKDLTASESKLSSDRCQEDCVGDDLFKCGGDSALNFYTTSIRDVPVDGEPMGCFEDKKKSLSGEMFRLRETNTPGRCLGLCLSLGYRISGTKDRDQCHCGNARPSSDKSLNVKFCNSACSGNRALVCGTASNILVYTTGISEKPEEVTEKAGAPASPTVHRETHCEESLTEVGGRKVCKGSVIFQDHFSGDALDTNKWAHHVYIPYDPDFEFVMYVNKPGISGVKAGQLRVHPILQEASYVQSGTVRLDDCTKHSERECHREALSYFILPPLQSARIHTEGRFSFKYGIVEMRAKLPAGDWILGGLALKPAVESYGPHYMSGKIRVALGRGNKVLRGQEGAELGSLVLEAGATLGTGQRIATKAAVFTRDRPWSGDFHNYTFVWTPDNMYFVIDGKTSKGLVANQGTRLSESAGFTQREAELWRLGSNIAPFDKEFYLDLSVFAGGTNDFPDNCVSGTYVKPWSNTDPKSLLRFWQARKLWYSTWGTDKTTLKVDYIKVTAL